MFIRLTGCPLRCSYCDTAYAFHGGHKRELGNLIDEVRGYKTRFVCVTGGEPLAQPGCLPLLVRLCDESFDVSLETSGAIDLAPVDDRVKKIVDLKTPASGESHRNRWENLAELNPGDELKFVVTDRSDFDWATQVLEEHEIAGDVEVLFSPVWDRLTATELAGWLLDSGCRGRLQIQLHKLLFGERPGT